MSSLFAAGDDGADQPWITLNDGRRLPQLGLGSSGVWDQQAAALVGHAAAAGYRLVDTAACYANESGVGSAVRAARAAGRTLLVTTKLWNTDHGYDKALRAFDRSVDRLGLEAVDLYLVHWPVPAAGRYVETWRAFVRLREEGRVLSIGVSNFTIGQLQRLIDETGVTPAVNQVELHPRFQQQALRAFHRQTGIATQAWSPLGVGAALQDMTVGEIARKHGKTPAQVVLRWHLDSGNLVIPKTVTPSRMAENLNVFGFRLDPDDLARMAALDSADGRRGPNPETFGVESVVSAWRRRFVSLARNPGDFGRRLRRFVGR